MDLRRTDPTLSTMRTIKIFLASSEEMEVDRMYIGNLVRKLNNTYRKRGIEIELFEWEDHDAAYNGMRKQDEYNQRILDSRMFVALFHRKAGKFTLEEFNIATEGFRQRQQPKVYTYCKDLAPGEEESDGLAKFKKELFEELGHYWTRYGNTDTLQLHLVMQLQLVETENIPKLEIRGSRVLLDEAPVADLANIPFVAQNAEYRELTRRIGDLDTEIEQLTPLAETTEALRPMLTAKQTERHNLKERLEQHEQFLFDIAMTFAKQAGERMSERLRYAQELFEQGRAVEANAILDLGEIDRELTRHVASYKTERENCLLCIRELRLKATTAMSDTTLSIPDRFAQACRSYDRALEAAREIDYAPEEFVELLFRYAYLLGEFRHYAEQEPLYTEALEIYRELARQNPEAHLPYVAMVLNNLANLYKSTNRLEKAEKACNEALVIRRELARQNPGAHLPDVATTLNNLANLHQKTNRLKEAEQAYNKALEIHRELARQNPEAYLSYVAASLNNLASLYQKAQSVEEAEKAYNEALKIYRELARLNPEAYLSYVAMTLNNLAVLHSHTNRLEEAEKAYNEALGIRRELARKNAEAYLPNVATSLNNLATLHADTNRLEEAEKAYNEALEIRCELARRNPEVYLPDVATSLNNLANLYKDTNRFEEAEKAYNEALVIQRELARLNSEAYLPDVARSLNNLAALYSGTNRFEEGEKAFNKALGIYCKLAQQNPEAYLSDVAMTSRNLGIFYEYNLNDYTRAAEYYAEAYSIYKLYYKTYPSYFVKQFTQICRDMADICEKTGDTARAAEYRREAEEVAQSN